MGLLVIAAAALLAVLVLAQGGFYAVEAASAGVLFAVIAIICAALHRYERGISIAVLLFIAVGLLNIVSAFANGMTLSMLAASSMWFLAACACFAVRSIDDAQKKKFDAVVCWIGIVSGVLGILIFARFVPFPGAMSDGRLQFTFQYANTAGIWFAVMALLCAASSRKLVSYLAIVPLLALLTTGSVGALLVFVVGAICVIVVWVRAGEKQQLKLFAIELGAVFVIAGIGLFAFYGADGVGGSFARAQATLAERLSMMGDAFNLALAHPLLGTGPDTWRYEYPFIQSLSYESTIVHCAYLQLALDAGLLAPLALIAVLVLGAAGAWRTGHKERAIVIMMIAVHAAFDIDFSFAAIVALLAFLIGEDDAFELPAPTLALGLVVGALSLIACAFSLWAALILANTAQAAQDGDASRIEEEIAINPLAAVDTDVQSAYLQALWKQGDYERMVVVYEEHGASNAEQVVAVASALWRLGDDELAENMLIDEIEREPYNEDLLDAAKGLFAKYGMSDLMRKRCEDDIEQQPEKAMSQSLTMLLQELG